MGSFKSVKNITDMSAIMLEADKTLREVKSPEAAGEFTDFIMGRKLSYA